MQKWWGWGDPDIAFSMADKPKLWPWVKDMVGLKEEKVTLPIRHDEIQIPDAKTNANFVDAVLEHLSATQIKTDREERILHSYGKSFPDLFRVRKGIVSKAPDFVIYPSKHEDVVAVIQAANEHNVCVIPFGGGTNIVGCVEATDAQNRLIVSLDLRDMNKLVSLDAHSLTATIEAGALGPKLEDDLMARGYTLGHHPDSFQYSTLGGWIATRSAGMQSDAYGRIEDMVVSLRIVTPSGEIQTRTVPATSAGPSVNHLFIGSEGILGVITEATMRIHVVPAVKDYQGFLFKSFEVGLKAIHECYQKDILPTMFRLQDENETELAFNMKAPKTGLMGLVHGVLKRWIKAKGYAHPAMMIVGFEGQKEHVEYTRARVFEVLKAYEGFGLGSSVGESWSKHKFNVPYLRDYLLDYGVFSDVAETAATWKNLLPLYQNSLADVRKEFDKDKAGKCWIGCHVSHSYKTGASLYFTYAGVMEKGRELEQYYHYKKSITQAFMDHHGALSHHHAVGTEHLPWLKQEVTPLGIKAYQGIKDSIDPQKIMNPGKLIPERPHPYMQLDDEGQVEFMKTDLKKVVG